MNFRNWLPITVIGALLMVANVAQAESRPVMLKAPPPGVTEFPACCDSCNASGCTGCNSGPEGLNCGSGLIKAECSMDDNNVSCKKDEARPSGTASKKLKTAE